MFKRILACAVVFLTLPGAAVAEPYDDALAASENGDYPVALRLLRPLARQGDGKSQFQLWLMHEEGVGVVKYFAETIRFYRWAADQGPQV